MQALSELPDALFCVAGGTANEVGFLVDISNEHLRSCMENNYFAAAFIARAMIKRWTSNRNQEGPRPVRHLVLTASTAALVALPGYTAYTPSKAATRALADTLRQEVLLYKARCDIRVHCCYLGNVLTDSFYSEQESKPALCKLMEGSNAPSPGITPSEAAKRIIRGLQQGNFSIVTDFETRLLLNNMRGPSPRDASLYDWVLGFFASLIWLFFRKSFDAKTIKYGQDHQF